MRGTEIEMLCGGTVSRGKDRDKLRMSRRSLDVINGGVESGRMLSRKKCGRHDAGMRSACDSIADMQKECGCGCARLKKE